jgi:hypothetical protein
MLNRYYSKLSAVHVCSIQFPSENGVVRISDIKRADLIIPPVSTAQTGSSNLSAAVAVTAAAAAIHEAQWSAASRLSAAGAACEPARFCSADIHL